MQDATQAGELQSFLESVVGPGVRVETLGSRLWRATRLDVVYLVRVAADARRFRQELLALESWGPRLPPGTMPRLVAAISERLSVLVFECLEGKRVGDFDPDAPQVERARAMEGASLAADPEVYRLAGAALRGLHEIQPPPDTESLDGARAVGRRLDSVLERADEWLSPARRERARALGAELRCFREARRVACHRDFQPRNWLLPDASTPGLAPLAVLGWEHARFDHPEADFLRLEERIFPAKDALREAFYSGYGSLPDDASCRRLEVLGLMHALSMIVRGRTSASPELVSAGEASLSRLLAAR